MKRPTRNEKRRETSSSRLLQQNKRSKVRLNFPIILVKIHENRAVNILLYEMINVPLMLDFKQIYNVTMNVQDNSQNKFSLYITGYQRLTILNVTMILLD